MRKIRRRIQKCMRHLWSNGRKEPISNQTIKKRIKHHETNIKRTRPSGTGKRRFWKWPSRVIPTKQDFELGDRQVPARHFGVWKGQQIVAAWSPELLAMRWGSEGHSQQKRQNLEHSQWGKRQAQPHRRTDLALDWRDFKKKMSYSIDFNTFNFIEMHYFIPFIHLYQLFLNLYTNNVVWNITISRTLVENQFHHWVELRIPHNDSPVPDWWRRTQEKQPSNTPRVHAVKKVQNERRKPPTGNHSSGLLHFQLQEVQRESRNRNKGHQSSGSYHESHQWKTILHCCLL